MLSRLKMEAENAPISSRGLLALPVAVVVYRCGLEDDCGGLGDRLCGITSIFYHYGLRLRSLFFIDMPAFNGAVRPATFNWDFPGLFNNGDGWLAAYANVSNIPVGKSMLNGGCLNLANDFPCMYSFNTLHYEEGSAPEIIKPGLYTVISNRGIWANPEGGGDGPWIKHQKYVSRFGLNAANWGCLYRSILWPTDSLIDEIAADIAPFSTFPVALCAHFRSNDKNMREHGLVGVDDFVFSCTREALQFLNGTDESLNQTLYPKFRFWNGRLNENAYVFFSADSSSVKSLGTSLLGIPGITVATSTVVPQHSNWKEVEGTAENSVSPVDVMRSALRDWFTLGACPAFSSDMSSAFVRTAGAFSRSEAFFSPVPGSRYGSSCTGFRDIEKWLRMGSGT